MLGRARHLLEFAGYTLRSARAGRDLRRAARDVRTPEAALELTRSFASNGLAIPAHQVTSEVLPLFELLRERPPRTVVEIGSAEGGSLFLWARTATPDAWIVSIDHPGGHWGGSPRKRAFLHRQLAQPGQRLKLFRIDSHDPKAPERLRRHLHGRPVDFLFIDGDHAYEGVRADFETYAAFVAPGGVVALHDVNNPNDDDEVAVQRYWRELRADCEAEGWAVREFVDPARGKGIGVLTKPGVPASRGSASSS